MITIIPNSFHQSTERSGTTNRFESQKQQSMNLLQRVKDHLQYRSAKIVYKSVIDAKQLDEQVKNELDSSQPYDNLEDDFNHQKLIDSCVRDILRSNKPVIEETDNSPMIRRSQRSSFSMLGKNIPKNRIKRLSSTILVNKMVKNKGLDKPTISQIKQQQIDKIIELERERKRSTEIVTVPPKILLPIILTKNQERESLTISQRLLANNKKRLHSLEPSPLLERHTTLSMVSDSFEQSPKYESNRRIETIINQINNEKDEITTHQRRIKNSIVLNQKNFSNVQLKMHPTHTEKYNYLKHEQSIFGKKVRQRKL